MITFIGVLSIVLALLALITSVFFFGNGVLSPLGVSWYFSNNPYEFRIFISFLLFGGYLLAQGIGVLNRQEWARIMTIILPFVYVGFNYAGGLDVSSPIKLIFLISYGLFLFIGFLHPKIAEQFKKQPPAPLPPAQEFKQ